MSTYTPDCFVILKIKYEDETLYKVLAGFGGSYLYGDSWKLNSGIVSYTVDDEGYYNLEGYSGSTYRVHPDKETVRISIAGMYNKLTADERVEHISLEDFVKEFEQKI